jgi:hypothetical protein
VSDNIEQTIDFLRAAHPGGPWSLVAIYPYRGQGPIEAATFMPDEADAVRAWIAGRDGRMNLYWLVNRPIGQPVTKAAKDDIAAATFFHVDADPHLADNSTPEQIAAERARLRASLEPEALAKLGLPPATAVVDSGGGFGVFWRLDPPVPLRTGKRDPYNAAAVDAVEAVNKAIEKLFGAPQCFNIDRIMRLPGTANLPNERKRRLGRGVSQAALVPELTDWGRVYKPADFTALKAAEHKEKKKDKASAVLPPSVPPRLKKLIKSGGASKDRSADAFAACLGLVRAGLGDEAAAAILIEPAYGISSHYLDQADPHRKALHDLAKARDTITQGKAHRPPEGTDAIVMLPALGGMRAIIEKVEDALIARGRPIYQRGGRLVRPVKLDHVETVERHGKLAARRDAGATVLVEVDQAWLLDEMNVVLKWFAPRSNGDLVPAYPEARYAQTLLAQQGSWRFPVLKAIVNHPVIDRGGRIIDDPGYDADSGLLLDFEPGAFPPIPRQPNRWDALTALGKLARPFRAMPFVDSEIEPPRPPMETASLSVLLSALLTSVSRAALDTAPVHGFTAPQAGSGKTMPAECVGILATGVRPSLVPQSATEEEDEKRLTGCLLRGDQQLLIDNCERPLTGRFLCSMTTGAKIDIRVLGRNDDNRSLPNIAFTMATGNNLTIAGDMTRRVVMCTVDSGLERPEERSFDFNPRDEVRSLKPELVVAALTILRAYHVAGRPVKVSPFGDFEDWSWVRGALVWLDKRDPTETREQIKENDPDRATLVEVMDAWDAAVGGDEINTAKIGDENDGTYDVLRQRLIDATGRPSWNAIAVGRWLTRHKGRPVAGRMLVQRMVLGSSVWCLKGGMTEADRGRMTEDAVRKHGYVIP